MTNRRWPLCRRSAGVLVVIALLAIEPAFAEGKFFRYVDAKGRTVLVDKMPAEDVARGYEVLDNSLQVIEVVPSQLSAGDREAASVERLRQEEEKRLQAWDVSLLRRYSSVEDIEAARNRSVNEIEVRVSILRSNLLSVKGQIEREQAKAADAERMGQEVPTAITAAIDSLQGEIADIEESIALRRQEVDTVKAEFERDIQRFQVLQPQVEFRRQGAAASSPPGGEAPLKP